MNVWGMVHEPSRRNKRGGSIKWHGKGYREDGELYIQLRRAYNGGPFTRYHAVNENCTMQEFWRDLSRDINREEGFPLPEGLFLELQAFRGKRLNDSEDQVKQHFDGGETVYAKVFDEDGNQWILNDQTWEPR